MNYSEVDILNFVEGRLDDQQTAEFLSQLRNDAELASTVEAMQASQIPIAQAYELQSTPPIPETLRNKLNDLTRASQLNETIQHSPTSSLASDSNVTSLAEGVRNHDTKTSSGKFVAFGLAACLVAGVAIGVLATQSYLQQNVNQTQSAKINTDAGQLSGELRHNSLVKRIADYQSLYVENTVANLSDAPINDALKLLASTDNLNDSPSSIPDFSELGYEFARAQELGFEGETLVQLVYRKPGSAPLALCFMRDSKMHSLPMNVSKHHGLNAASWVSENHHYVLVAQESEAIMKQLYDVASDIL